MQITGGRLYAYLKALAVGASDFAVAALRERARVVSEKEATGCKRKATVFRLRFKGVSLTNPQQTKLYVIDDRCRFAQVFSVGGKAIGVTPLNNLREWIEAVETGRLVMATLALERSFGIASFGIA